MSDLESRDVWPQIARLADTLPLADLARRFGVSPGEISGALERTRGHTDALPLGASPAPRHEASVDDAGADLPPARAGSKDARLLAHADLLGKVPDGEVARLAGVSIRTVASYRARHHIPGYAGPRRARGARGPRRSRLDTFSDLLGAVPDRVVAERAGVSLNAVRNYRVKRGIPALGRPMSPATSGAAGLGAGTSAWQITWRLGGAVRTGVVLSGDLHEAVARAEAAERGDVVGVVLAGVVLDEG
ncbi:MAG: hypothetical protein H6733_05440 [Alphaproteobacteria bacterium]|nr:hypothetical protein [Alphaproteobacteria bacterium]